MGADQADGRQPWSKQQRQDNHELADIRPHWTQRLKRGFTATALLVLTVLLVDGGHACVSVALVVVQTICFGELVAVSYQEAQRDTSEAISPLFRTMQWAWFAVAMAIAYSTDFLKAPMFAGDKLASVAARFLGQPAGQITADIADFVSSSMQNVFVHSMRFYRYEAQIAFSAYMSVFIATVMLLSYCASKSGVQASPKKLLRQLNFTFLALALTVLQIKMAIYNVFQGLVWFILPALLVVINDSAAMLFGRLFGKRLVRFRFLSISPNKSWEGFVGAGISTLAAGYFVPPLLSRSPHLLCPFNELHLYGTCAQQDDVEVRSYYLPPIRLHVSASKMQLHGLAMALFASAVAPFGGFFASFIKRAYGLKDFANSLPGHGGFMDRFDCQLVMFMCTYVYLTAVRPFDRASLLVHSFASLTDGEKRRVIKQLQKLYNTSVT